MTPEVVALGVRVGDISEVDIRCAGDRRKIAALALGHPGFQIGDGLVHQFVVGVQRAPRTRPRRAVAGISPVRFRPI